METLIAFENLSPGDSLVNFPLAAANFCWCTYCYSQLAMYLTSFDISGQEKVSSVDQNGTDEFTHIQQWILYNILHETTPLQLSSL